MTKTTNDISKVHTAATILDKTNLIKYDRSGKTFQPTALGRVASYFYVTHQTMARYNEYLKPTMSDIEIFRWVGLGWVGLGWVGLGWVWVG